MALQQRDRPYSSASSCCWVYGTGSRDTCFCRADRAKPTHAAFLSSRWSSTSQDTSLLLALMYSRGRQTPFVWTAVSHLWTHSGAVNIIKTNQLFSYIGFSYWCHQRCYSAVFFSLGVGDVWVCHNFASKVVLPVWRCGRRAKMVSEMAPGSMSSISSSKLCRSSFGLQV